MEIAFSKTGCLMLIAGIILSIITVRRMINGAISIPRWSKILLIIGMLLMNLILFLSILPPRQAEPLTPQDPIESIEAAQ